MTDISLKKKIIESDNAKKANPLDLSSDQDLTIALMNLLAIEEICEDYVFGQMVESIRTDLMARIVDSASDAWDMSKALLAESVRLIGVGEKFLSSGDKKAAYNAFDNAYEVYTLFWGINMGLVALGDIKMDISEI